MNSISTHVEVDVAHVIGAAATSTLGILALLCLLVAGIAALFFRKAHVGVQLAVFVLIFFAAVAFGIAVVLASNRDEANTKGKDAADVGNSSAVAPSPSPRPSATTSLGPQPIVTPVPSPSATLDGKVDISFISMTSKSVTAWVFNGTPDPIGIEWARVGCSPTDDPAPAPRTNVVALDVPDDDLAQSGTKKIVRFTMAGELTALSVNRADHCYLNIGLSNITKGYYRDDIPPTLLITQGAKEAL